MLKIRITFHWICGKAKHGIEIEKAKEHEGKKMTHTFYAKSTGIMR
jgi:hypothetical protein